MKKLNNYKKNGFQFELDSRLGDVGLFKGSRESGAICYEVILIQWHNGREVFDKFIEAKEYPPSENQWGSKGWTFKNYYKAQCKFWEIVENRVDKGV